MLVSYPDSGVKGRGSLVPRTSQYTLYTTLADDLSTGWWVRLAERRGLESVEPLDA